MCNPLIYSGEEKNCGSFGNFILAKPKDKEQIWGILNQVSSNHKEIKRYDLGIGYNVTFNAYGKSYDIKSTDFYKLNLEEFVGFLNQDLSELKKKEREFAGSLAGAIWASRYDYLENTIKQLEAPRDDVFANVNNYDPNDIKLVSPETGMFVVISNGREFCNFFNDNGLDAILVNKEVKRNDIPHIIAHYFLNSFGNVKISRIQRNRHNNSVMNFSYDSFEVPERALKWVSEFYDMRVEKKKNFL